MDSRVIDNIIESLVFGNMGVDDFMQAVQDDIEAREASTSGTSTRVVRP
jgi:hypothetical protein